MSNSRRSDTEPAANPSSAMSRSASSTSPPTVSLKAPVSSVWVSPSNSSIIRVRSYVCITGMVATP